MADAFIDPFVSLVAGAAIGIATVDVVRRLRRLLGRKP